MLRTLRTSIGPRVLGAQYACLSKQTPHIFSNLARLYATAPSKGPESPDPIKIDKPTYQLTFTCKKCSDRSSHLVSKQAYHHGTVLIQCPSCKNRHLIADNLKVFGGGVKSLEDILASRGEKITKASLDGDLQWEPETPKS